MFSWFAAPLFESVEGVFCVLGTQLRAVSTVLQFELLGEIFNSCSSSFWSMRNLPMSRFSHLLNTTRIAAVRGAVCNFLILSFRLKLLVGVLQNITSGICTWIAELPTRLFDTKLDPSEIGMDLKPQVFYIISPEIVQRYYEESNSWICIEENYFLIRTEIIKRSLNNTFAGMICEIPVIPHICG